MRHLAARPLGRDRQDAPLYARERVDRLVHHAVRAGAVHRDPSHPAHEPPEWPAKERVLAEERDAQVEREHRRYADHEVPVGGVRRHGDHELGQVGHLPFHAPPEQPQRRVADRASDRVAAQRNLVAQDRPGAQAKSAAIALRSTLPPEMTMPTRRPRTSRAPFITAAVASAPVGSTTSFMRSHRKRIASTSSESLTVTMSCTCRSTSGKVSAPRDCVRAPSAIVCGTSMVTRLRVRSERAASSPAAGSTPTTRVPGERWAAAIAQPESSPAPPQQTNRSSRGPTSSKSSLAAVPWPAITAAWSKGGTTEAPVSRAILSATCARSSPRLRSYSTTSAP